MPRGRRRRLIASRPFLPLRPQLALKAKEAENSTVAPYSKTYNRTLVGTVIKAPDGGLSLVWALPSPLLEPSGQDYPHCILRLRECRFRLFEREPLAAAHPPAHAEGPPFPLGLQVGRTITVGGWVKTGREAGAGAFAFLEVGDGTSFANLQVWGGCGWEGRGLRQERRWAKSAAGPVP